MFLYLCRTSITSQCFYEWYTACNIFPCERCNHHKHRYRQCMRQLLPDSSSNCGCCTDLCCSDYPNEHSYTYSYPNVRRPIEQACDVIDVHADEYEHNHRRYCMKTMFQPTHTCFILMDKYQFKNRQYQPYYQRWEPNKRRNRH